MSTTPLNQNPLVVEGVALAGALAPLAGPYGVLADQLIMGGLQAITAIQAAKVSGTITREMLQPLAILVGNDLAQLEADFAAQENAAKLGFQPQVPGPTAQAGVSPAVVSVPAAKP